MQKKIKILFVDDEERIVKLLNIIFRASYEVFTATSGREALQIFKQQDHIHILVTDQRMPEMLGIELLTEVRKISPNTIRILLTGYTDLVAIIGAVNEGEVYRFLNKPWDQNEIRKVISECADLALAMEKVPHEATLDDVVQRPRLATAANLLALDGVANDRHEIMEMFTNDYNVLSASNIKEALSLFEQFDIGVIVADSTVGGEDTTKLLETIKKYNPFVTIVMLSSDADSNSVIRLINKANIYRYAMKPISPNVFRLAVNSAMNEHHRLLANPRLVAQNQINLEEVDKEDTMAQSIVKSLSRFTKLNES